MLTDKQIRDAKRCGQNKWPCTRCKMPQTADTCAHVCVVLLATELELALAKGKE
jgi:hypothetical protein